MNIVYALTRNYYRKILPSLRSLAEYHPDAHVYILAEDNRLPFETPLPVRIVNISKQRMFDDSVNIGNKFGGYINLLKVYYPTLLPNVDKVIHLDVDTIICDYLDDFWNIDLSGKWFASVPEYEAHHGREKMFGDVYYNMGVSLINLKQMREDCIEDVMAEYLIDVEQPFADQDAWNKYGIEMDKAVIVPLRFNENMSTGYTKNPAIVHYCGIDDWYERITMFRKEYLDKYRNTDKKYLIHTCKAREWYVNDYLRPSMINHGIPEDDIIIWLDKDGKGNLASFVASCKWIGKNLDPYNSTWHLQDDVVLSEDFFQKANEKYDGLANAFCNEIFDGDRTNHLGVISANGMWFSFQCILIPNKCAAGFADWFENECVPNNLYPEYVSTGRCDDSLFREYIVTHEPTISAINIYPCVVDHIDYLLGGSTILKEQRANNPLRKAYWRSKSLDQAVFELEQKLKAK